ncbi:MAG: site-specific DNA-methyltransferase [Candidatus Jettenia sp.]|nr:site-specific DNA-methyltransferase [Candidatus Jettenia sp.]
MIPDFKINDLQIFTGDCRKILPALPAESVQCCVTSPPYWGLRDYNHSSQIGAEPSPVQYVKSLVEVFSEVWRVLRKDGTLWLNIGDGYARNGFALQEDGWIFRSRITWVKKTAMPESVKNRPTNATEDIFLMSKSPTYYYNATAVREASGANLRNYWLLGPDSSDNGHPATFPRELVRRCILLGSQVGDSILDPFGGSGTTGVVAQELDRSAVLIELNPKYSTFSKERISHGCQKAFRI